MGVVADFSYEERRGNDRTVNDCCGGQELCLLMAFGSPDTSFSGCGKWKRPIIPLLPFFSGQSRTLSLSLKLGLMSQAVCNSSSWLSAMACHIGSGVN